MNNSAEAYLKEIGSEDDFMLNGETKMYDLLTSEVMEGFYTWKKEKELASLTNEVIEELQNKSGYVTFTEGAKALRDYLKQNNLKK